MKFGFQLDRLLKMSAGALLAGSAWIFTPAAQANPNCLDVPISSVTVASFSLICGDNRFFNFTGFEQLAVGEANYIYFNVPTPTGEQIIEYGWYPFLPVGFYEFSFDVEALSSNALDYVSVLVESIGGWNGFAGSQLVAKGGGLWTVSSVIQPLAGSQITFFTQTIGQSSGQPSVPAPLPLFGAGVAMSFSRRLRRRIKSSA